MTVSLVLTVLGPDRPGLVETISETLATHDANWLESRMASLAGTFAGVMLASVPDANVDTLTEALRGLESRGLRVTVEKGAAEQLGMAAPKQDLYMLQLELVGQDRPGIVRDISRTLANLNISVDELHTEVTDASWSGETLFHATAEIHVPKEVAIDKLRQTLEGLANELMVDINLEDLPA